MFSAVRTSFVKTTFATSRCFSKEAARKSVKAGAVLVLDGAPHKVIKFVHGKRGKGGGFVKATVKNILNDSQFERTFTADEIVEHADMEFKHATYSWNDGETYNFMDTTTFDEIQIPIGDVDNKLFLGEGMNVKVNIFRDRIVSVELPQSEVYTVVHLGNLINDEALATLNTGAEIHVPASVSVGQKIKVHIDEARFMGKSV